MASENAIFDAFMQLNQQTIKPSALRLLKIKLSDHRLLEVVSQTSLGEFFDTVQRLGAFPIKFSTSGIVQNIPSSYIDFVCVQQVHVP